MTEAEGELIAKIDLKVRVTRFRSATKENFALARDAWVWAYKHKLELPDDVLDCFAKTIIKDSNDYHESHPNSCAEKAQKLSQKSLFFNFVRSHESVTGGTRRH